MNIEQQLAHQASTPKDGDGDASAPLLFNIHAIPILNSCMKDRCGFLIVRHKRRCCTEFVSWEHAACPLSGIKKRPLVGG